VGQSSETKKLLSDQILNFGPNFLKTCELWSTYFSIVGKNLRRNTRQPNIVDQSTKTNKLWGVKFWRWFRFSRNWWTLVHIFWCFWKALRKGYEPPKFCGFKFRNEKSYWAIKFWTLVPIFLKLLNFGPHISELLQSPQEGIQDTQILWAKVQKQKSYRVTKFWTLVPIFSKTAKFGPHLSALLENPQEGIQDTKILWAKVQKQKSYERSNFDDDSDFLEIGELWSTYYDVFVKPSRRDTNYPNFVGQSSETKKLSGDQILKFGPDFLENGALWSTYFKIVRKH